MGRIIDNYFEFVQDWVLFNKEHTFTFVFIGENGTQVFEEKIYIGGTPDWKGFRNYLEFVSFALVFTFLVFSAVLLIIWLIDRHRSFYPVKFRMVPITGAWITGVIFGLYFSHPFIFGLPYYYFGDGSKLWGDIVVGWALWIITTSLIFYIGNYFWTLLHLERTAYQKPLSELKKRKLGGCSGLVWFTMPLALVSGVLDSEVEGLFLVFIGVVLMMFTHYILETVKSEGVLLLNLLLAGFLAFKYHPDFAFVVIMVVLLVAIYPIQKKCFNRFVGEKERLIAEIKERTAKIEGAGR